MIPRDRPPTLAYLRSPLLKPSGQHVGSGRGRAFVAGLILGLVLTALLLGGRW